MIDELTRAGPAAAEPCPVASIPVLITGLTLAHREKIWDSGDRPLAYFDAELLGFALHGCVLIRTSRGGLLAQAPRGDSGRKGIRAIQIVEPSIRQAMADAAYAAFLTLGGREEASI